MTVELLRYFLILAEETTKAAETATPAVKAATGAAAKTAAQGATPAPMTPPAVPVPSGAEVKGEVVGVLGKIVGFFKYDFFPNLWMYLTLIFMLVLCVVIFAAINFIVRSLTDPVMHKVLRFGEDSRVPAVGGGILSIIVAVLAFHWIYATFPALQPPVHFILNKF
jgi:hypothetical protein